MEEDLNEDELEARLYALLHHADETQSGIEPEQNETPSVAVKSTLRRYWRTSGEQPQPASAYTKVNIAPATPRTPTSATKNPAPLAASLDIPTANKTIEGKQSINSSTPKLAANKTIESKQSVNSSTPKLAANKNIENKHAFSSSTPKLTPHKSIENKPALNSSTPLFTKPKDEKDDTESENIVTDLQNFPSPLSQAIKSTVEILENDEGIPSVELETSDEDEVVEVAVPPKQTIMIESSDEDEICVIEPTSPKTKTLVDNSKQQKKGSKVADFERDVATSPVPSVVSSVSDEFMRGDCIAFNITSRNSSKEPSFDFSLHGPDLIGTPLSDSNQNKKKRKRNKKKDKETPTTLQKVNNVTPENSTPEKEEYFATPKNKSKSKKQKKNYSVSENTMPNPDVYDSDSNQSIDNSKKTNFYSVTEKSLPNVDVYESDSSLTTSNIAAKTITQGLESSDSSISVIEKTSEIDEEIIPIAKPKEHVIDLTDHELYDDVIQVEDEDIEENIFMANVTGFEEEEEDYAVGEPGVAALGSSKIPPILNEDLDFDNVGGKEGRRRRFSLKALRTEMEKFYNESWGGEDFNHKEIQKNMSRDQSLWEIDPRDRTPAPARRRVTCNYCHRAGHRDAACRARPPVCHMCGRAGHAETRCPDKICVNCGAPNHLYSTICRNCFGWSRVTCGECGRAGHPASHCPDRWRRYHSTVEPLDELLESRPKRPSQQFCSGCARRGHLVHACRVALPFSGLPVPAPYVGRYAQHPRAPRPPAAAPAPAPVPAPAPAAAPRPPLKRQSKSPAAPDHLAKRRTVSLNDDTTERPPRKLSESAEKDYIPINSNHDKKGQVIQCNEVSDTSESVTVARVYVPAAVLGRLRAPEGRAWLAARAARCGVLVTPGDSYLNVSGSFADQEQFQAELRAWAPPPPSPRAAAPDDAFRDHIPKKRLSALKILKDAFDALTRDLGDPAALFKELTYLQNNHEKLLKMKIISPQKLTNSRGHIAQTVKRLNMVLLGQGGLGDGARHVARLRALRARLAHVSGVKLSKALRQEIAQHYGIVFTGTPRDDYTELIKNYVGTNRVTKRQMKFAEKRVQRAAGGADEPAPGLPRQQFKPQPDVKTFVKKMIFCQRRLHNARPATAPLRKARNELVRRLHTQISALNNREKLSAKCLKKMRQIQKETNLFLSNNV